MHLVAVSYGRYSYGLYSHGLYSYGVMVCIVMAQVAPRGRLLKPSHSALVFGPAFRLVLGPMFRHVSRIPRHVERLVVGI